MIKRILSIFLCFCLMLCMIPTTVIAAEDNTVMDAEYQAAEGGEWRTGSLSEALNSVYESGTVRLLRDIALEEPLILTRDVTLTSKDASSPKRITSTVTGHKHLLHIKEGTVILKDIYIDGGYQTDGTGVTSTAPLILLYGESTLYIQDGTEIRNNYNTYIKQNGISDQTGGGVNVYQHGTVIMSGGAIHSNYAYSGAGVLINSRKFTLNGGEIRDNHAINSGSGGGVYVYSGAFNMTDGKIKNNAAENTGGGICQQVGQGQIGSNLSAKSDVNITGGSIIGNTAKIAAGFYASGLPRIYWNGSGTFGTTKLSNVEITGNSASLRAGGMMIVPGNEVTVSASVKVSGNTATGEPEYPDVLFGNLPDNPSAEDNGSTGVNTSGHFVIESALTGDAQIRLDTFWKKTNMADEKVLVAQGTDAYTITQSDFSKFVSTNPDYDLILKEDRIYLVARIPATAISLSEDSLSMRVNGRKTLTATLTPGNATVPITWTSSDASVATVEHGVVTAHKPGTVTITASVPGDLSAACVVTVLKEYSVVYDPNGGTGAAGENYTAQTVPAGETITIKAAPARDGYTFIGWSDGTTVYPPDETIEVNRNITLTAQWEKDEQDKPVDVPAVFIDHHYAYIVGYDDGLVRPEANITRAAVATIFFRLLDEETRNQYTTRENRFVDVSTDAWYNTAVSTLAAMGIVTGRPGGIFDPNANITRAEFTAMAARFDANGPTTGVSFTDISGHWAQKEITIAANNGWVLGYEDGTFRPDQSITRAEAMTMVNRVLQRIPERVDDLHPDMTVWPDNTDTTKWYYLMVQEATNGHDYIRKDNGYERWSGLRETPDWTELER